MKKTTKPLEPPTTLAPEARERWRAVVPALQRRGAVDTELLAVYCQVWVRWRQAEDTIAKTGQLVKSPRGGAVASPLIAVAKQASTSVRSLEQRLGIGAADEPAAAANKRTDLATRAEAVRALGLPSPRALDRLIERGAPGPVPGKRGAARYDVAAIEAWRTERQTRTKPALDLATERAALARVQRQLTELKLREARGELVKGADAERVLRALAAAAKAQLLAVPRRAVLGGLPREHEPLLKRLIVEALRELTEVRTLRELDAVGHREQVA